MVGVSVRLALQDYTALVNYIPQKFYRDGCQSDDVMKLARLLGLRHPSEPSVQACTALYLGFDMGLEAALTLSGEQRFAAYKIVRNTLKSKAAVEPPRQIQTLPSEPATFKESYPDMWAAAYGTIDSPQIMPGHLRIRFNELTAAIPMRCTHSSTAACRLRLMSGASNSGTAQSRNMLGDVANSLVAALLRSRSGDIDAHLQPTSRVQQFEGALMLEASPRTPTPPRPNPLALVDLAAMCGVATPAKESEAGGVESAAAIHLAKTKATSEHAKVTAKIDAAFDAKAKKGKKGMQATDGSDSGNEASDDDDDSAQALKKPASKAKKPTKTSKGGAKKPASKEKQPASQTSKMEKSGTARTTKNKDKAKPAKHAKAHYSHEQSRSQYMCRFGKGPGSSHRIPYGSGGLSKGAAEKAAIKWVKAR
jgi:hypothetical protein